METYQAFSRMRYMTRTVGGALVGGIILGIIVSAANHSNGADAWRTIVIAGLGAIVLGFIIGILNFRRFVAPMGLLSHHIASLAEGRLTPMVEIHQARELEPLAQRLNAMVDSWHALLVGMQQEADSFVEQATRSLSNANQVNLNIEQVSGSMQSVAAGAQTQTASTLSAKSSVTGIHEDISALVTLAGRVSESAQSAQSLASQGVQNVAGIGRQMGTISESVVDSSQIIHHLRHQSNDIRTMMAAIEEISAQTHTLAINASIEAARSGDAGRGFTVIATEIRKLAAESAGMTQNIADRVDAIDLQSQQAVRAMKRVETTVATGSQMAEETVSVFERIRGSADELARVVSNIYNATTGISSHSERISSLVAHLADIALETSSMSQTVAAMTFDQSQAVQEIADSSRALLHAAREIRERLLAFTR